MKIQIKTIGLDYRESDKEDCPVIHYDIVKSGKVIGSSMAAISRLEAEKCLSFLEDKKEKIEKELNS